MTDCIRPHTHTCATNAAFSFSKRVRSAATDSPLSAPPRHARQLGRLQPPTPPTPPKAVGSSSGCADEETAGDADEDEDDEDDADDDDADEVAEDEADADADDESTTIPIPSMSTSRRVCPASATAPAPLAANSTQCVRRSFVALTIERMRVRVSTVAADGEGGGGEKQA